MDKTLNDYFSNLSYLDVQSFKNISIIGVETVTSNDKIVDLLPLKKGLDLGLVTISECEDGPSVNRVSVKNNAVTPLLILDSEELMGAKQNRIANNTYIIPAKTRMDIGVSCTEEGRWSSSFSDFKYSDHFASSSVRRAKSEEIYKSLNRDGTRSPNQSRVWSEINDEIYSLDVESDTSALRDMYTINKNRFEEYQSHFPIQENQTGSIIFINGKLVGVELFHDSNLYKNYHDKIVESYIPNAIKSGGETLAKVDYDVLLKDFIDNILDSNPESFDIHGLNDEYRIDDENITGSITLLNDDIISSSLFRKVES